jgi:branched-chain amino acid transport system substrate-binding protein
VTVAIAAAVASITMGWLLVLAAPAPPAVIKIGVSLALTGPEARYGLPMLRGVELAVEEANRAAHPGGATLEMLALDSASPGQGAISRQLGLDNYQRFVADEAVVAVVGPQTSGEARAAAPLLGRAGLVTITPSATTFDLTDPAYAEQLRPGGRTVLFRTIATDLAQGDAMARFAHGRLQIRRVVVIDDGSDFGVRMAAAFSRRSSALGMTVLAGKPVAWAESDYRPQLHEASALNPEGLYFSGSYLVGVRLAQQIAEIMPWIHRMGTENLSDRAFPLQAGAASEQWFVPNVAPDVAASPEAADWAERFRRRFGQTPSGYALTAYTAAAVIVDAVERLRRDGRPVTRTSVRLAIEVTRLSGTPQGVVSFDRHGDLEWPIVSIYEVAGGAFRFLETVTWKGAPGLPAEEMATRP